MYYGIASANQVIASADYVTDAEVREKCLGEAYFLRGYNYYRLFAQYGGVVLQTQVTEGVVRTFTRASAEETLNQVIDDLQTLTTNCLQIDGVVQVHGLNTQQHTSWQKLCCTVSLNVAATGTQVILLMLI